MIWEDGFIESDMIIWKDLAKGGYATKGFIIEPQDLRNSKVEYINRFGQQLSKMLTSIRPPFRVQIKWGVNSDYSDMLGHYIKDSQEASALSSDWSSSNRGEIANRYVERMENGELRRERLLIFISTPIKTTYSATDMKDPERGSIIQKSLLRMLHSTFRIESDKLKYMFGSSFLVSGGDLFF